MGRVSHSLWLNGEPVSYTQLDVYKRQAIQLKDHYLATGKVNALDLEGYGRFTQDPETWAIYYETIGVTGFK